MNFLTTDQKVSAQLCKRRVSVKFLITSWKIPITIVIAGLTFETSYWLSTLNITLRVSFWDVWINLAGFPIEASVIQLLTIFFVISLFFSSFILIFFLTDEIKPSTGFSQGEYGIIESNPIFCVLRIWGTSLVLCIAALSQTSKTLFSEVELLSS